MAAPTGYEPHRKRGPGTIEPRAQLIEIVRIIGGPCLQWLRGRGKFVPDAGRRKPTAHPDQHEEADQHHVVPAAFACPAA